MSEFTTTIIEKPKHFRIAHLKSGFGKRPAYVIGFDTEAYNGEPMLLQFALPDQSIPEVDLVWTDGKHALDDFLEYLEPIIKKHSRREQVIVVGWNLRYEYTQLFRMVPKDAWDDSRMEFHFHDIGECAMEPDDGWSVMMDVMNDKLHAFTVAFNDGGNRGWKGRYTAHVIDGMAFFNTSLNKAASIVGIEGKDDYPEEKKGKVSPKRALKDLALQHYSRKDAFITRQLGEKIVEYHKYYDARMTLSAPMFASTVFRRRFLVQDEDIPLCAEDVEDAGLKSYHGGKNGYYLDRPAFFEHAYDYDVNAAYTSAMANLPDPVTSIWTEQMRYIPGAHAIWYVKARVASCDYRAFQENNGRWHTWKEDGDLAFWVTGYELDEALRHGEVLDIYECTGFVMEGEEGVGPLRRFCDEMYELKRHGATPEERQMAKLCLNSIYGKFIQKVPAGYSSVFPFYDYEEEGSRKLVDINMVEGGYRAGGLYHPAMASLVTGSVRARIHAFEHKYQSLMTSTDGFLSRVPPDAADIGDHFGGLKVKEGSLSIWRERLYVFEPTDGDPVYALHGFRGKLADLRAIPLRPGKYRYGATMMVGLRDSLHLHNKQRYQPGQFIDLPWDLDLTSVSARSPIRA